MRNSDKPAIDKRLVQSLKEGDISAFETVFHLLERKLYYVIFSYTKSEYISEEIVQEVFIKIWEKRGELDPSKSFVSFIFTVAKNHAFNYMRDAARRRNIREELWENISVQHDQVESEIILKEYREIVEEIIRGLPPRKQSVFNLSRKEGKTHAEIAEILGMSVKRVKNHLWEISEIIKIRLRPYLASVLFVILIMKYYDIQGGPTTLLIDKQGEIYSSAPPKYFDDETMSGLESPIEEALAK